MKYILFVRNAQVAEEITAQIGENSVSGIFNLENFEKYPSNVLPEEFPINGIEKYSQQGGGNEYQAIIALNTGKPKELNEGKGDYNTFFFRLSLTLARSLKKLGIDFLFWPKYSSATHIYGIVPNLKIIPTFHYQVIDRSRSTINLILETIRKFPNEFKDKELDIWLTFGDEPSYAMDLAKALDLKSIFAYCTTYSMKDRVISLPDCEVCYDVESTLPSTFKEAATKSWQENKIFWRGTVYFSFSRKCLFELGKKYPQYLQIEDSTKGQFIPMPKQAKYKYLIDTRGFGWSIRLRSLLMLGRVIFVADRPFREWFFDRLIPMEHYVPVKEDMSDLIEKYFFMERHPELYEKIVRNMAEFVEENLNPRRILFDTKELLLKYGVVKK